MTSVFLLEFSCAENGSEVVRIAQFARKAQYMVSVGTGFTEAPCLPHSALHYVPVMGRHGNHVTVELDSLSASHQIKVRLVTDFMKRPLTCPRSWRVIMREPGQLELVY